MKWFPLIATCFSIFYSNAQTVSIRKVELAGDKVLIFYDLEDSNPNNEYLLNVYTSKDNFIAPLSKVKGDVGGEMKPGSGRRIEWSITEEYGPYKGRLALELRGKVYIPFVKLNNFNAAQSYKRGKSYNLAWKAGSTNPIHIELYKGGQRISGEMNQPNNGDHTFYIPDKAKPGDDYRLKITDAKNQEDIIYTSNFKVTPKIPLLLKVLPIAIVGGVVAALSGGSKNSGGTTEGSSDLPKPPLPQ